MRGLARDLDTSPATVHRIFTTFEGRRLLDRDDEGGYRPAPQQGALPQPGQGAPAFEVDDLEAFARESAKKGYPLSDGPHPHGKDGAIAFIDAPEGYEIELIQHAK